MDHLVFKLPVLNRLFKLLDVIPIAQSREDPELKQQAFDVAAEALRNGELVMIFPEDTLTKDGEFRPFRNGVLEILERHPVPVIPMALRGMWGSFFSRVEQGEALRRPLRRGMRNRIELVVDAPVSPGEVTLEALQARVEALRGDCR